MSAIRLVHVSDVHVMARSRWRMRDLFSKRLTSWVNLRLRGRARRFANTQAHLLALQADLCRRPADVEDLIRMKRAAGRPKDLIEVEVLSAVRDETDARS